MSPRVSAAPPVVVDAAVSLKWVLDDESAVAAAVALRDVAARGRVRLLAPSLWLYEANHALVVAHLRDRVSREQGELALFLLQDMGVLLVDPEPADCATVAVELAISGYDAAYVALARALETHMWTGNQQLVDRVRSRTDRVRWIGDFAPGY